VGYFFIFQKTGKSKQSPNRQKFAQSSHPDRDTVVEQKFVGSNPSKPLGIEIAAIFRT
jgi:hypothetical protein